MLSKYSIPPPFFMFYIISITQIYFLNQVMKINYFVFLSMVRCLFAVLHDILLLNLFSAMILELVDELTRVMAFLNSLLNV